MNCPQCGAELSNSATSCPRCGTSLRPTSFSYLPAGAPPWPNTLPQGYSYGPATAIQTPPTTAPAATSVPAPKPRRSAGAMLLVIVLVTLSVVLGVGGTLGILALNGRFAPAPKVTASSTSTPVATPGSGTPSVTPAATPQGNLLPTPTSFITIKSQAVGVSLKYPGDWIADPPQSNSNGSTVNLHPQQQIGVDFIIKRLSSSATTTVGSADAFNQASLQSLSSDSNIHNYSEIQPANATPTIAGVQWFERDATLANADNVVFHVSIISVVHNKLLYNIFYYAPGVAYSEAMQKYYSQMLASFQFTS
jgi:hypothetical protein